MNIGNTWLRIWGSPSETESLERKISVRLSSPPSQSLKKEDPGTSCPAAPPQNAPKLTIPQNLEPDADSASIASSFTACKSPKKAPEPVDSCTKQPKTLRPKPSIASLTSNTVNVWWKRTSALVPSVILDSTANPIRPSNSGVFETDTDDEKQHVIPATKEQKPECYGTVALNALAATKYKDEQATFAETTSGKRNKTWSFWKSTDSIDEKKDVVRHTKVTNNILHFTSPLADSLGVDAKVGSAGPEDAVLYKPHHSAKEFKKINIHKNENIPQSIIVPDWELCLPLHSDANGSEGLNSHPDISTFNLKSWFSYFSSFSLRFGFKGDDSAPPSILHDAGKGSTYCDSADFKGAKYRFYGKSLTRLPPGKRACLTPSPAANRKCPRRLKRRKTQAEDNNNDVKAVSVSRETNENLSNDPEEHQILTSGVIDGLKSLMGSANKVKRILVIGVHGFFPNKMIRPIIGNPTGTSSKFANEAEKAIIRYCVENDMMSENDARDMSIAKIALEKEGKIFDRTSFFLDVLIKWEAELNEADCILFAAHSQGCVVSILLLARLINDEILKNPLNKKLGLLCMAGVNNGPFYGVDKSLFIKAYSAFEHESMLELFELTKFNSPQSIAYKESMKTIIASNGKICFIGSIDDQLVPFYSALASHIYHPNIYRACYIDQSAKAPPFITKLVLLCLQLQNLGYFDNGVIKELSAVLAGPITGGGHSKIYNDGKVYDLGIKFLLDTSSVVVPTAVEDFESNKCASNYAENQIYVKEYNVAKLGTNPFILPWCLRGLLFNVEKNWRLNGSGSEASLANAGAKEVSKLYDLFDDWKAETKIHKELKFRLNGIRSSKL